MALCNDFDITDLGELKFMLEILVKKLMTVLTNLHFSANLHTFTKSSLTLACKILHLFFTPLGIKHNLSISQSPMSEAEKQAYKEYASNI